MTDDRRRLGPPPIEPLSDVAWARVERAVWAQIDADRPPGAPLPPPRRWWLVAAPLAAAAAVVALVIALRAGPPAVDEPSRVVSGPGPDPTSVMLGDSHIVLDPDTAVVMRHEAEHPTVLVERGGAWFTVAPRRSRPEFIVRAGDATIRVVGTRFRVARSDERIAVEVERGLVDVNFRGSAVAVGAGQRWSSDTGRLAALAPTRAAAPALAEPPDEAAPAAAPPDSPPASAPGEAAPPSSSPGRASVPPSGPQPPVPHPVHRAPRPAVGGADLRPAAPPTAPPDVRPGSAPGSMIDREQTEYDRLAALEARSPDISLTGYIKLAQGTSRWADPALFAAARLAVDRGDRRAPTLLGMYLQRFPAGANATDARQLLAHLKPDAR